MATGSYLSIITLNVNGLKKWKWSHSVVSDSLWPMDCSLPGISVHGIFQARILEWVAISFSRRSSNPGNWTRVSRIVGRHFTVWATREVQMAWIPQPKDKDWLNGYKNKTSIHAVYKRPISKQRTHTDSKWRAGKRYFMQMETKRKQEQQYSHHIK